MSIVIGLPQLQAKLARLTAAGEAIGNIARDSLADDVADEARRRVNVETGALRGTIRVEDGQVLAGSEAVGYAVPQEFDAETGQPFMRPAADGAAQYVPEAAAKAKAAIEGIV